MSTLQGLAASDDSPPVVVLDVPLLVEFPPIHGEVDHVLAIEAPETLRASRAVAGGLAEEDVLARMERQASDPERRAIADTVLDNSGTSEEFQAELAAFWDREVQPSVA